MDIYDTYFMLAAVEELPIEYTFFRDRYFPTNVELDVFGTSKVLADYANNTSRKMAPFVLPRVGSIPGTRDGFKTYELEPANISVSMSVTLDQLIKRNLGESILSGRTPDERARMLLMQDLNTLNNQITRREEYLAVETMLGNGCTMRHISDKAEIYEDVKVQFYDGDSNPAQFTPSSKWEHSTYENGKWTPGNWFADINTMIRMLTSKGRPAREIIVDQDVANFLMEDGWVLALLDNRRVEFGKMSPTEIGNDCDHILTFNFNGKNMPIICNFGTYENEFGVDVPYLPSGTVIVTAPGCGRGLYGAVTQMEDDKEFHTYAGRRVPQSIITKRPPAKETQLTSRPLFVPNRANPWTTATGVFDEE